MKKATMQLFALLSLAIGIANGQDLNVEKLISMIRSIEKEVVDLTATSDLQRSTNFQQIRKSVSSDSEFGKEIVTLIRNRRLSVVQSQIAVHILSILPEEQYWEVASPLLTSNIDEAILSDVLLQQLSFGPCYANASRSARVREILDRLKKDKSLSENTRSKIDFILKGKASEMYRDFAKDPEKYGQGKSSANE